MGTRRGEGRSLRPAASWISPHLPSRSKWLGRFPATPGETWQAVGDLGSSWRAPSWVAKCGGSGGGRQIF